MDTKIVETTGRSVEEAITTALEQLQTVRNQVAIEILEEPRGGLLGLGHQPARVRVSLLAVTDATSPAGDVLNENIATPPAETVSETNPATEPVTADTKDDTTAAEHATAGEPDASEEEEILTPGEYAQDLMQGILDYMNLDATAYLDVDEDDEVVLEAEGEGLGILIGRQGSTLNAIQYLISVILNHAYQRRIRVTIDAEGYRERRTEALERMARKAAEEVRQTQRIYHTEYLRAPERRIIHLSLQNDSSVFTYSEGEDPYRRVVIAPADTAVEKSSETGATDDSEE